MCAQRRLRPVWSESSQSAWRKLGSLATHWAHSEDSDQTGRISEATLGAHAILLVFVMRRIILSYNSDCGNKYVPNHGHVDYAGKPTTYGQTLPVICEDGYQIHGKPQVTCMSDGTWSSDSSCTIKGKSRCNRCTKWTIIDEHSESMDCKTACVFTSLKFLQASSGNAGFFSWMKPDKQNISDPCANFMQAIASFRFLFPS